MREGRIPAQCAKALAGNGTLSSDKFLEDGNIIHENDLSQPPLAKNYLNHVPTAPKLFVIPASHKPRAKIVQETNKKLAQAYLKPKASLKDLQFHDESGHRVKSQRREAAVSLLQVMNYYQDDASGRIGRLLDNGTFRDMSLKSLAEKAGIAFRRAKRALHDIVRAGYLKVTRQFFKDEQTGEVKGLPSIRSFLPKFFIDLDVKGAIWTKWFTQRGWAQEREKKKNNKHDRKKARAMMGLLKETIGNMGTRAKSMGNKVMGIVKGVPSVPSKKESEAREAHEKKILSKTLELFNLDPSKSISEYYKALKESHPFK